MLSFSSYSLFKRQVSSPGKWILKENQRFFTFIAVFLFFLPLAKQVFAGASASNWVVVVNGQFANSRTIANHYCSARNVPGRNVIVLPNVPEADQITVDQFRDTILGPVLKEIEVRGLAPHIQGIAYSADFPTARLCMNLKKLG